MSTDRLNLPQLQTRMMVNALRSVRVGGSVVYSTCTLSPTQNEMVVENACALARTHYGIKAVERSLKKMENRLTNTGLFQFSADCRRGSLLLPTLLSNFGPTYVCKILSKRWLKYAICPTSTEDEAGQSSEKGASSDNEVTNKTTTTTTVISCRNDLIEK
ncbi:hypothetical protein niasHT_034340 [Heterodera trifolii]|uniref:NOL1/NOP2/Sun domain family member 4 n=1 Tax=Heterodera trifolii TaxID=157864 RepID=A0ABD2HUQ1_9BILA